MGVDIEFLLLKPLMYICRFFVDSGRKVRGPFLLEEIQTGLDLIRYHILFLAYFTTYFSLISWKNFTFSDIFSTFLKNKMVKIFSPISWNYFVCIKLWIKSVKYIAKFTASRWPLNIHQLGRSSPCFKCRKVWYKILWNYALNLKQRRYIFYQ